MTDLVAWASAQKPSEEPEEKTSQPYRVIVYERKSFDPLKHIRDGAPPSIEGRLEAIRAYCESKGWTVVAEYYDNDTSARHAESLADMPEL